MALGLLADFDGNINESLVAVALEDGGGGTFSASNNILLTTSAQGVDPGAPTGTPSMMTITKTGTEVSRGIANDGLTIMLDEAQNIAVLNANIVEALQDIGFYTTQVTDSRIQVEDISINGNPTLTITFTTGASAPGNPSATITPTQTGIAQVTDAVAAR